MSGTITITSRGASGLPSRAAREQCQQLVVQDLHLALRVVRHVEAQRFVAGHQRLALRGIGGQRFEIENGLLHLVQQVVAAGVGEQVDVAAQRGEARAVDLRRVEAVEQADVVAALLAPGGQQRVGMQVQCLVRRCFRRAGLGRVAMPVGLE
jgi:hypothetical protein